MGKTPKMVKQGFIVVVALLIIVVAFFSTKIVEDVAADEIIICQFPVTGTLEFWTEPGMQYQGFGTTSEYEKAFQYYFTVDTDRGEGHDQAKEIIFNDAGRAKLSGSVRIILPRGKEKLRRIQEVFGSMKALKQELVRETVNKVLFSTGPLMSSFESYAEKKTDLINYIEDQMENGVYKTQTKDIKQLDELSGKMRTVKVASIVEDSNSPLGRARQELAPFVEYGLTVSNLTLDNIIYDERVMKQIDQQQSAYMRVKTAIAQAKEAEQEAIRVAAAGKATAAKAKWEQEKLNATDIALAEKQVTVARLEKAAAILNKAKNILDGQGIATKKSLVMNADGALTQKLAAWERVQFKYAEMIANYKGHWVPQTYMGGGDSGGAPNGAKLWIDAMGMKAMKDLNLDMGIKGQK